MAKKPKIDLFSAGTSHTNACLNFSCFTDHGYIEGYRLAADLLVQHVETTGFDHDYLIYPIAFNYRHHFELLLKKIIIDGSRLDDNRIDRDEILKHSLMKLWPIARPLMTKVDDRYPGNRIEYKETEDVLKQFEKNDDGSTSFRYPTDKDGKPSLPGLTHVDLARLRDHANKASKMLDGFSGWIMQNLQSKHEMESDRGANY